MTLMDLVRGFVGHRHGHASPEMLIMFFGVVFIGLLLKTARRASYARMLTPERFPDKTPEEVHAGRQCFTGALITQVVATGMLLSLLARWSLPGAQPHREYFIPWGILGVGILLVNLWLQSQAAPLVRQLVEVLKAEREVVQAEKEALLEQEGEELDRISGRMQ